MIEVKEQQTELTLDMLSKMFGIEKKGFSNHFLEAFKRYDFNFSPISGVERDHVILEILQFIEMDKQKVAVPERKQVWQNGWKENLDQYISGRLEEGLVPKFIRPANVIRLNGAFVRPEDVYFEKSFSRLIQAFCYDQFIKKYKVDHVYEFGCGSCFNLLEMTRLAKKDQLSLSFHGSDFVQSSVDLCSELAKGVCDANIKLEGSLFDMMEPDLRYVIKENSCVFTAASIEQLGNNFEKFIDYLIVQKPKVCYHLEPIVENYDENDLFDYLQIKFHRKRGYPVGLKGYLEKLEEKGLIKIIKNKRLFFGSKMHECFNFIVWELAD